MSEMRVDFKKTVGPMKPMHGVNNGPLTCAFTRDARDLFKEAGIPISRLHDTEYPYGSGEFVDIPCIFKDFRADVDDPESYNFAMTDYYIQAIKECNTDVLYRLGITIEHAPIKRYVTPPKDFKKWAQICEHIIRHYNEGWNNGYHWDIKYWEIWCEPNHNVDKLFWDGTPEEFAHFYDTVATYLKEKFPYIHIGGPAFSNPESLFVDAFFDELTKDGNHPPMDFFSWHGYVYTIDQARHRAEYAQMIMDKYGYGDSESIYDEYNYVKSWNDMLLNVSVIHSEKGAAFNAAMMAAMQNTTVKVLTYYDSQMKMAKSWCGLFKEGTGKRRNGGGAKVEPDTPFYAFKAFNIVYNCKNQAAVTNDDEQLYPVAAYDENTGKGALMISYYDDIDVELETKTVTVDLSGVSGKTATLYLVNEASALEPVVSFAAGGKFTYTLKPYNILLVTVE